MPLRQAVTEAPMRRYDSETVRRTLARAAELEAQENDAPLTAEQIETLGRELGLSADAVRRSLGELEAPHQSAKVPQSLGAATIPVAEQLPVFPQNREIVAAAMPGILYGLFMGLVFLSFIGRQMLVPGLGQVDPALPLLRDAIIFCFPPLLALWSGWQRRDWRLGALSGLLLSLLSYMGMYIGLTLSRSPYGITAFPSIFVAAILLGIIGGLCGRAQLKAKAAQARANNR